MVGAYVDGRPIPISSSDFTSVPCAEAKSKWRHCRRSFAWHRATPR